MKKAHFFGHLAAILLPLLLLAGGPALAAEPVLDLYLARHGQTDWNLEKRLQGGTDNHLNETGRAQARQLGDKLAGIRFAAVYHSSLARAGETAALARPGQAGQAGKPLAALAERSFGKFEGMYEDGRDAELSAEFKARSGNLEDSLDGGESIASQARRVAQAITEIRARHRHGSVLIVSHGGVTPLILAELLQLPVGEAVSRIKQGNDEIYLIRLRGKTAPQVWKLIAKENLEQL